MNKKAVIVWSEVVADLDGHFRCVLDAGRVSVEVKRGDAMGEDSWHPVARMDGKHTEVLGAVVRDLWKAKKKK